MPKYKIDSESRTLSQIASPYIKPSPVLPKITHPELVKALSKPGEDILNSLTPIKCHLLHMAVGVSGEGGEILELVKKYIFYEKPIDLEKVINEIGDILYYLEGLRQAFGISHEECIQANINKLTKRYGEKYSNEAAIARVDVAK